MTWVDVGASWLGHRPEALIHERLWSCPLTGAGPYRGELDERGRGLAYRQTHGYEERTTYAEDRIVVPGVVETFLEDGRTVRSVYPSGEEERYHYDDGRLVEIDEPRGLMHTAIGAARWETGGPLHLSYDNAGLRSIEGTETVWERLDEPWGDVLARATAEIAAGMVADVQREVEHPT